MSTFFFFNDTATTEIYTLSLHDALPISGVKIAARTKWHRYFALQNKRPRRQRRNRTARQRINMRSEEHTSELQSQSNLVCRLLLEKKKSRKIATPTTPLAIMTLHAAYAI